MQIPLELLPPPPIRRPRNSLPPNGAQPKRKGSAYERTVAAILRAIFPEAHRGDQRSAYFRVPDVDGTPLWIETKAGRRVNLHGAWRQAVEDWNARGAGYRFPVVVARNDRQADLVVLRLEDFLPMLAGWLMQEEASGAQGVRLPQEKAAGALSGVQEGKC